MLAVLYYTKYQLYRLPSAANFLASLEQTLYGNFSSLFVLVVKTHCRQNTAKLQRSKHALTYIKAHVFKSKIGGFFWKFSDASRLKTIEFGCWQLLQLSGNFFKVEYS